MTETTLTDGLMIMLIGVSFVMSFLCILVFAMSIMSKIVIYLNKIFPEVVPETPLARKSTGSEEEAVAIAIAVVKAQG